MAPDKKVCPLMSRIAVKVSCSREELQWWFKEDSPAGQEDCVIQAIRMYLSLSATKPR
jgi:hypothetical protein